MDFNSIPINIRVPGQYIEFDNSNAVQGTPAMPNKILVLGQKLAAGTALANTPVLISTADQAIQLFGRGSELAAMFAILKQNNNWTESWAIPQADNPAGTAATGSITVGGVPTSAGTQQFYIAGTQVLVAVTANETAANIATAIVAAIAALPDLPVSAAVDGVNPAKVNLTALHKGEFGNTIDVRALYNRGDAMVPGLTLTVAAMAAGAGNPDLTAAIAATADVWYNHWIVPYTDAVSLTAVNAELDRRFGPLVQMEGHAYLAMEGTVGALASFGNTYNTYEPSTMGYSNSPSPAYLWAAAVGAVSAYYTNIDPARPLQTLPLLGILAPAPEDRFIQSDRNNLLFDGISTFTVDDGGTVRIERLITMYRNNTYGLPDPSYLDVETMFTLFWMRYSVRAFISQQYPRYKIADDGTKIRPGSAVTTPSKLKASIVGLAARDWEGFVLEDISDFKTNLIVQRNGSDANRVDALMPPNLINQLRVFAGQIQFIL